MPEVPLRGPQASNSHGELITQLYPSVVLKDCQPLVFFAAIDLSTAARNDHRSVFLDMCPAPKQHGNYRDKEARNSFFSL